MSTQKITHYLGSDVLFSLVNKNEEIIGGFESIFQSLISRLNTLREGGEILDFKTDEYSTIEIRNIPKLVAISLVQNFDIIYKAQSLRIPNIKNDEFNQPQLTWGFNINAPKDQVIIGVLDNGVRSIPPLAGILVSSNLDITDVTNPNPTRTNRTHGTAVATLAAIGPRFFDQGIKEFVSDAFILPIKILDFNVGCFNIYEIERVIIEAIKIGTRIFNLSVCGPTISYNSPVSEYAYLLDKLAYNYDILIFIAAGNLDEGDIQAMQQEENSFHDYPNHFYNPNLSSESHLCEATNICIPAESFNNLTVGAIAENYRANSNSDLTPFKELPAYYTRKHYFNIFQKVNGTHLRDSQKNRNINKPDIVMPGGDRISADSGMQTIGFGELGNDFFNLDSGTSLAAPLAANLAAKIVSRYPDLNMQSVKALILNCSKQLLNADFLTELVKSIRQQESLKKYNIDYKDLEQNLKTKINSKISPESLYRNLIGFGLPLVDKALYSNDKSVTIMIQDVIAVKSYKVINLNIPEYLLNYSKTKILLLEATLCYKFFPIWGNHLGYNPLHISFNFSNSLEKNIPDRTSEILAMSDDPFYNQFYRKGMSDKQKLDARNKAKGIKTSIQSWSEDYYPPSSKPFSNVQQLALSITTDEIKKVKNQISIVIRCTCKPELEKELKQFLNEHLHEFSIALNVAEKSNSELKEFSLYNELINCNELQVVTMLDIEGNLDAEL